MSDSDTVENNLDDFEAALYGDDPVETVEEVKEEVETSETTPSATNESEPESEVEADDEDGDDAPEEPVEEDKKPRKRKNAQERIDALTREKYELQRLLDLERQERNRSTPEPVKSEETPAQNQDAAPTPNDVDDKGEPKYPLGEFDPTFIRDLTTHMVREEHKAAKLEEAAAKEQAEFAAAQKELTDSWTAKVNDASERLPDLGQKFASLQTTFADIPQDYGNFLASSIMTLENGPDVLNYLADNLDEAKQIISSGAFGAVISLGRLDAKFAPKEVEREVAIKATQAPPPPPSNKGSSAAKSLDPTNLDDFEKLLYQD